MGYCSRCGKELSGKGTFCPNCGAKLKTPIMEDLCGTNDRLKKISSIAYTLFALVCLFTLITEYHNVSDNLDGWHGMSAKDALGFACLCLCMSGWGFFKVSQVISNKSVSAFLGDEIFFIVLPLVFHLVTKSLAGNVETDFEYLLLRYFQGFDDTYILLFVLGIIGSLNILRRVNRKKLH